MPPLSFVPCICFFKDLKHHSAFCVWLPGHRQEDRGRFCCVIVSPALSLTQIQSLVSCGASVQLSTLGSQHWLLHWREDLASPVLDQLGSVISVSGSVVSLVERRVYFTFNDRTWLFPTFQICCWLSFVSDFWHRGFSISLIWMF